MLDDRRCMSHLCHRTAALLAVRTAPALATMLCGGGACAAASPRAVSCGLTVLRWSPAPDRAVRHCQGSASPSSCERLLTGAAVERFRPFTGAEGDSAGREFCWVECPQDYTVQRHGTQRDSAARHLLHRAGQQDRNAMWPGFVIMGGLPNPRAPRCWWRTSGTAAATCCAPSAARR